MTQKQRETVDTLLREAPLDLGGDVAVQRPLMEHLLTAQPLPDDVRTADDHLGGVPVVRVEVDGLATRGTVLHLHGGGFALGTAASSVGLAAAIARHTGMRVVSVDYRLAPEHPYPAAALDVAAAYAALVAEVGDEPVVVSGESAGGNLALTLLLEIRRSGLRTPAAAVLLSPMTDLTVSGDSFRANADKDPNLTAAALGTRSADYLRHTGVAADDPRVSPLFADLRGLPPLLVQAGSNEVLLDDATRLAARAAAAGVEVVLDVTPDVPHVFQAFAGILDEGEAALVRLARFVHDHTGVQTPVDAGAPTV
ncbi:alpha/beta hydrolase [Microlunatus flavus]|uniref:Acetyl esterase/lipase n=1 Tax=Microlunatus flavus TaxID=1036181 RepID=A0A1H9J0F5_9ACTN|nr:alpha/beta hydrolase [Microlunatus flavus]SEQ80531.1 Acetyl esterase/lipase [Microlunatus flavus]